MRSLFAELYISWGNLFNRIEKMLKLPFNDYFNCFVAKALFLLYFLYDAFIA